MTLELTDRAELEAARESLTPQLVLKIDGLDTVFGAVEILRLIRIGDTGLLIGDDWVIGGLTPVEDQEDAIKLDGSSSRITQQIEPDKGSVSSVSSVQLSLIDFNNVVTEVISPGVVLDDILGRKATLYMGFQNTAYPDDFVPIFVGVIDDVESAAGVVKLNIAHPEQKKRQQIFTRISTSLNGGINSAVTTLTVDSTSGMLSQFSGTPSGVPDDDISYYVRIGDEIIQYTGVTATTITGCTRGALGTTAAAHADGDGVDTFYVLEGNAIELALKIMLGGQNGFWVPGDLEVTSFLAVDGEGDIANAIFFRGLDVAQEYGVTVGDFVNTYSATDPSNVISLQPITAVEKIDGGSYIVIDDAVTLVREEDSPATIGFRSQWDTLGHGLAMTPDQVDIEEHLYWRDLLLADFNYRFYLKDTMSGKEFLDKELYAPMAAFSIPRKGRCSMGYHLAPIPRGEFKILNDDVIKNPSKIKLRRTVNKNFYNTIVFQANQSAIEDKYLLGYIYQDADSTGRIPMGNRVFKFESSGIRDDLDAALKTESIATRLLNRYKFGAEFIQGLEVFLKTGWVLEPGDVVLFDPENLQISETLDGTRNKRIKAWEIVNKSLDLKTGAVTLDLVDTNGNYDERYGLISPSSLTDSGCTTTALYLQESFGGYYPDHENKKWENYVGLPLRVHSEDYSFDETVTLDSVDPSDPMLITVTPALSGPPPSGYVVDIGDFPDTADATDSELYKVIHGFIGKSSTVASLGAPDTTVFSVQAGDADDIQAGDTVRVFSADHVRDSGDVEVLSRSGNQLTLETALSFSIQTGDIVYLNIFPDRSKIYRVL